MFFTSHLSNDQDDETNSRLRTPISLRRLPSSKERPPHHWQFHQRARSVDSRRQIVTNWPWRSRRWWITSHPYRSLLITFNVNSIQIHGIQDWRENITSYPINKPVCIADLGCNGEIVTSRRSLANRSVSVTRQCASSIDKNNHWNDALRVRVRSQSIIKICRSFL